MASPALVRLHRYVALSIGAFIVLMGLTGAALVFRDELTAVFTPATRVSPSPVPPGEYQRILAATRAVEPDLSSLDIVPSGRADRAVEVIVYKTGPERYLFVDPHDGRVVADSDREFLPFAVFYQLHRRFMLGVPGEYAVAVAGLALVFMAVSGLVMWWPRKLKYAFRIRLDGNRVAVSYDLHRCAGAAFALLLILNAAIGIMMTFDGASVALVNGAAGRQAPQLPVASSNAIASGRPLDDIVAAAERSFPGGSVSRVAIRAGNAPVVVRKRLASDNDTHGMNRIYVDGASATVLRVSPLKELPAGNAMFEWLYPLHTGNLIGLPYKIILLLAGLVPALSLATGIILWRSRAKRKATARAAPSEKSAQAQERAHRTLVTRE